MAMIATTTSSSISVNAARFMVRDREPGVIQNPGWRNPE
jgi:hypothetical protein